MVFLVLARSLQMYMADGEFDSSEFIKGEIISNEKIYNNILDGSDDGNYGSDVCNSGGSANYPQN